LALRESDLHKIGRCGQKTVRELQRLQRTLLLEYPELTSYYRQTELPLAVQPPGKRLPAAVKFLDHPKDKIALLDEPKDKIAPATWSVLNRTLPDLFQLPPLPFPSEIESLPCVGALRFAAADLERLRTIAIFPEDSIDLLYSLSTGYLLQADLSDEAISIVLAALVNGLGPGGTPQPSLSAPIAAELSLYGGLPADTVEGFVLPAFRFPALLGMVNGETTAVLWSRVAEITEGAVIRTLGMSVTALRAIGYLWHLQELAVSIADSAQAGLPARAYGEFAELADCYLRLGVSKLKTCPKGRPAELRHEVLRARLGLSDGRKWTLQETGRPLGVTRERVRQLLSQSLAMLRSPETLRHLGYLWHVLDHLLASGGGVRYLSELNDALAKLLGWPFPAPEVALASIMELSANYHVVWDAPVRVTLGTSRCSRCAASLAAVSEAVETATDGSLTFDRATDVLLEVCHSECCPELPGITGFSKSLFHFLADSAAGFSIQNGQLCRTEPLPLTPADRQHLLQQLMLVAGKSLHVTEVQRLYNEAVPEDPISAINLYCRMMKYPSFLLWGPRCFKHRDLIQPPASLIAEIQQQLVARLADDGLPYVCLNGKIYEDYRGRLLSAGVPNPLAFYSCMRVAGGAALAFDEYPYVLKNDAPRRTTSVVELLREFVSGRCGVVTGEVIREFAVARLGFPRAYLCDTLGKANAIRIGNDLWLHRDNFRAVSDRLATMIQGLSEVEGKAPITAAGIYEENLAACQAMGITRPAQLTTLLKYFFPRVMAILRNKPAGKGTAGKPGQGRAVKPPRADRPRRVSVAALMLKHLEEQANPCKTRDLIELFRGASKWVDYLYGALLRRTEYVLWYTKDSAVARRAVEWDNEKQAAIEALATRHLEERARHGKPYGLCSDLFREVATKLPRIAPQLSWTSVLLHSLLGSGKEFSALGRQRDVFIRTNNPHRIATLDDLIFYTLVTEYGGTASRLAFISGLRKMGLMNKKLVKLLKGKDNRVVIEGNVVRAAGNVSEPANQPPCFTRAG
jgi:hypothetical protein